MVLVGCWVLMGMPGAASWAVDQPTVDFVSVSASTVQVGGPDYDFRISRFEIRNDEFAAFLNDAIANPENARGAYLYLDTESGAIFLHNQSDGDRGTNGQGTVMFLPSANPHLSFDGTSFVVAGGFEDRPVTGVSWFGAVKFCNWLTLAAGLNEDDRVYEEGAFTEDWRPAVISVAGWRLRDLTASERATLILRRGFRLPMDGGADGVHAYGEWFKAATAVESVPGTVTFDALYGYGRGDPPSPADANYLSSGDPFDPGVSPVGYFNGVNVLTDLTVTRDTDNAFGVYDLSGNVWEWMQDQSPGATDRRRNRGGSWQSVAGSLRNSPGSDRAAGSAVNTTGLRMVQSVLEPLLVTPRGEILLEGPWGGPLEEPFEGGITFRLLNMTGEARTVDVATDADWLILEPTSVTLAPHAHAVVRATLAADCASPLQVGEPFMLVSFTDAGQASPIVRGVRWALTEPLTVAPLETQTFQYFVGRSVDLPTRALEISNESDAAVSWSATWVDQSAPPSAAAWLTIDGGPSASGEVAGQGVTTLTLWIDPAVVAVLPVGSYVAQVELLDECTGSSIRRTIQLFVQLPLTATPSSEQVFVGPLGGPFSPESRLITLTNRTLQPLQWTAAGCESRTTCASGESWVSILPNAGVLSGQSSIVAEISVNTLAVTLPIGDALTALRLSDMTGGSYSEVPIRLRVEGLAVVPTEEVTFEGPLGGPFDASARRFTLTNPGLAELHWTAQAVFAKGTQAWFAVLPNKGTLLDAQAEDVVEVTLLESAYSLAAGSYSGQVVFSALGQQFVREISLEISGESFSIDMVNIPGDWGAPTDPSYFYRIGRFEVTNAEFARFLNDALRNRADPKGQYLFHHAATGSVYIHDDVVSEVGEDIPGGALAVRIYDASVGKIRFDAARAEPYYVQSGFERHPVVGVSWYGAAKFCNWLTLLQGMTLSERAYNEGPSAGDWTTVPLLDPSSSSTNRNGYRMPMDGRIAGSGAFNEWFKAASRTGEEGEESAAYGFGREVVVGADANYLGSGDAYDEGTTPVGFFDGLHLLGDGRTLTEAGENAFGLFDLCGNAAEWIHDRRADGSAVTRGGHFLTPVDFATLRNDGVEALNPGAALSTLGFRVAQSLHRVPLVVTQDVEGIHADGFVGGPFSRDSFILSIHNDTNYAIDRVGVTGSASWLERNSSWPAQLSPLATVNLTVVLGEVAESLGISPAPPGSLALVPTSDNQVGGPTHDFWVSTTEVTNDQFVTFLNNALTSGENARGAYLYHDTDSSSVYMHNEEIGEDGTAAPSAIHATLMYDGSLGRIRYSVNRYVAEVGFGRHPVVGVTWYGAVKYCNWLTLFAGLPERTRAYTEGPTPSDWRPATTEVQDWLSRGMIDAERSLWVRTRIGYRLPMDQGTTDVSPYNEWRKLASARSTIVGGALFDSTYGFGRDEIRAADANFAISGDTTSEGTNFVGFFDGLSLLVDGTTLTSLTANRYGLHDLSGNVAEWMNDSFSVADPSGRAVRGGSWLDALASSALLVQSRISAPAHSASSGIGFRVVRGTGHVAAITIADPISETAETRHLVLDLREPLELTPTDGALVAATFCDDLSTQVFEYALSNRSDLPMLWRAEFSPLADWLSLNGATGTSVEGELSAAPSPVAALRVEFNAQANRLPPGEHSTRMLVTNLETGTRIARIVRLEMASSVEISPQPSNPRSEFSWVWQGAPDVSTYREFTLIRKEGVSAQCDLQYRVSSTAPWLAVDSIPLGGVLEGLVPPSPESLRFSAEVGDASSTLPVGDHTAWVQFELLSTRFSAPPPPVRHEVLLHILDPIRIVQEEEPWEICCELSATALPIQQYTLFNDHATDSIPVSITADVEWLSITPANPSVPPRGSAMVTVALTAAAIAPHGDYPATLTFLDERTSESQERNVLLQIREDLSLIPLSGLSAATRSGGVPNPSYSVYTVRNPAALGGSNVSYRATSDQPWMLLNGAASVTDALAPQGSQLLVVSWDPALIPTNATIGTEMPVLATITLQNLANGEFTERAVTMTVVDSILGPVWSDVSRDVVQPNGPQYTLNMGTTTVTNEEFAAFLNNALAAPSHPRGEYLWFHAGTGEVFLGNQSDGQISVVPNGTPHRMFSPAVNGRITFDGSQYSVVSAPMDYRSHPVTGVSWIGALKYCNWLTLDQGLRPEDRCYVEAPSGEAVDWRPISISDTDWATRDLSDAERWALAMDCRGFRLPMDNGYGNATPSVDAADGFNEWFKAAAWSQSRNRNAIYGFGRDVMTGADANFRCSGDPFESATQCSSGGTTPTAYFDGTVWAGAFATTADGNTFGLRDMTGNVHQWMQDRYAPPTSLDRRTLRGGSWNDPVTAASLRNASRVLFASPDTVSNQIGFRVVQVPPIGDGDFNLDGLVTTADLQWVDQCAGGPGAPMQPLCVAFDFDQDGDVDLSDLAEFMATVEMP